VFERFDERARQSVVLAQDEARLLRHNYIGTEHLLLGLLREEEGLAARALDSLDITLGEVRAQVARIVGQGDEVTTTGQIPFTPRAKRVLELSRRQALELGQGYIGTEHILLGLAQQADGVAVQILRDFDAPPDAIREGVIGALSEGGQQVQRNRQAHDFSSPRVTVGRRPQASWLPLVVAFAVGALTLGLGIVIGWAIWGT
jgi:ATP-dependent Clp protease ATP-binding subunit ClpC